MTITQLNQTVYEKTENRFFLTRYCSAIKSITKEKGWTTGILSTCAMTGAKIYGLAFSYFCMEGSARSVIDVINDDQFLVRLRPLGDAAGWTALALFSALTITTLSSRFIKEGEYLRLKSIFQKWILKNKEEIEKTEEMPRMIYNEMSKHLDKVSSQCFFPKNLASLQTTVLTLFCDVREERENSVLYKDKILEATYEKIRKNLENQSSATQYFSRLYDGLKSIKKHGGYSRLTGSIIKGIALPIIFFSGAFLSFVGEIGLGKEIFFDRNELTDIGHFGEWPFNATEMIGIAYFLHKWCILNEGDFARTRGTYKNALRSLQDENVLIQSRLCKVANRELNDLAIRCHYFKLPSDYELTISPSTLT